MVERTATNELLTPKQGFEMLFRTYDSARGVRAKESAASEIARYATEENFDIVSILRATNKAYEALVTGGKDSGIIILSRIEQYFQTAGICHKKLVAQDCDSIIELSDANRLIQSIEANEKQSRTRKIQGIPSTPTIANLLSHLNQDIPLYLDGNPERVSETIVPIIANFILYKGKPNYDEAKAAYVDTLRMCQTTVSIDEEDRQQEAQLFDKVLGRIIPASERQAEGIPDIWTRKFNHVSLKDVFDDADDSQRGRKAVRFLSGMTAGDYFWQRFAQGIFFEANLFLPDRPITGLFDYPDYHESMLQVQKGLSEQMILPTFYENLLSLKTDLVPRSVIVPPDRTLDIQIKTIINRLDPLSRRSLGLLIAHFLIYGPMILHKFRPEQELEQIYPHFPICILAEADMRALGNDNRIALIDQMTHSFLARHRDRIFHMWDVRFFGLEKAKLGQLKDGFKASTEFQMEAYHTEQFILSITNRVGGNFIEKLNSDVEGISKANQLIWDDMREIDYWPNPHALHVDEFTHDSLPEIMGLKAIHFHPGENFAETIEFALSTDFEDVYVIGKILPDGSVTFSTDIKDIYPGLDCVLSGIVLASFHDLVLGEKIIAGESEHSEAASTLQTTHESTTTDKPKTRKPSRRTLPRKIREYDPTKPQSAKEIQSRIIKHREAQGYSHRTVDMHRSTLRGVVEYERLLALWSKANTNDRDALTQQLTETRNKMYQPNPKKIENLPPDFKDLKPFTDHNGEVCYRKTWVVGYDSPITPPGEDEKTSITATYRKYYRGASALSFLDNLKVWIVQ